METYHTRERERERERESREREGERLSVFVSSVCAKSVVILHTLMMCSFGCVAVTLYITLPTDGL